MLEYQIVAGFSEIKSQLRMQASLSKSLDELQLWFSFVDDVLYVHDSHDHKKCIALAFYKKNKSAWRVSFEGKAYGREVIEYAIGLSEPNELSERFNNLFKLYGYI